MNKNISEIFDDFAKQTTPAGKKQVLAKNDSYVLKGILRAAFHPNIKFLVEIPEYRPDDVPPGMGYMSLHEIIEKLYLFEEGNPKAPKELTGKRRKELLLQMLESLELREAKVLEGVIKKDLKVKGLTKKLVLEVFPTLLNQDI